MSFVPLALDLDGRRVLCVGGGRVGTRRATAFADAGALVRVVSPEVTDALAADGRIEVTLRGFEVDDLDGAELVHTATGVADVDAAVAAAAGERRLWCIDATNAERATAHVLVHREADGVTVAVHSHGDPRRSRAVADRVVALLEGTEPRCMDPLSR